MKHILNNLSEEEKNDIREQHTGGIKVMNENFSKLVNTKLGDVKPMVNENDFGGNNFKKVIYQENKEKSEILEELIIEIIRVRDLLNGVKKGPLKTNYLNKILNFYKELEIDGFDYKEETKENE